MTLSSLSSSYFQHHSYYHHYNHHFLTFECCFIFSFDINIVPLLSTYYQTYYLSMVLKKTYSPLLSFRHLFPLLYFLVTWRILLSLLLFHNYLLLFQALLTLLFLPWLSFSPDELCLLFLLSRFQLPSFNFTRAALISVRALPITSTNIFKPFPSDIVSSYSNNTQ